MRWPKTTVRATTEDRGSYRLICVLLDELRAQADVTQKELVAPWVDHELARLDLEVRTSEFHASQIKSYESKVTDYKSRGAAKNPEWLIVSVYNTFLDNLAGMDAFAIGCFNRIYIDDQVSSADVPEGADEAANWLSMLLGAPHPPLNTIRDPRELRAIGEAHIGVYELLRFARRPNDSELEGDSQARERQRRKKNIVHGALEIRWPTRKSAYPVFRVLYVSARSEATERLYETRGVVIPTADCVYLIGSETDLRNFVVFTLENNVIRRDDPDNVERVESIQGIIVRKHSRNSIFSAKVYFRRTASVSIEEERPKVGYKSASEIEGFERIRPYILNITRHNGESTINLE